MKKATLFLCLIQLTVVSALFLFTQPPPTNITPPFHTTTSILMSATSRLINPAQAKLVEQLTRRGVISHQPVIEVMKQVDRGNYVSSMDPYWDTPQGIQCGQTISAPHMHGYALEEMLPSLLAPEKDQDGGRDTTPLKMLDVGCGSGYLTAAMGRWVHPKTTTGTSSNDKDNEDDRILPRQGKVFGMDVFPELVDLTRKNLMKHDGDLLSSGTVELKVGNGWEGWPEEAPFDVIHVGAAADSFPKTLADQLALGGTMVIPIGPDGGHQYFYNVRRIAETGNVDKDFKFTRQLGVRYVPLIH